MQRPDNGIVNVPSNHSVDQTIERSKPILQTRGINGIRAFSVHPGGIYTDLIRHLPAEELAALESSSGALKTTEQGATSIQLDGQGGVYCLDCDIAELISVNDPNQELTGVLPRAIDPELAEQLWQLSEKMSGVKFRD
jgi:NAD(P)-dependent dehydrogenase (short-subunit alcohol dehydrogenase family)